MCVRNSHSLLRISAVFICTRNLYKTTAAHLHFLWAASCFLFRCPLIVCQPLLCACGQYQFQQHAIFLSMLNVKSQTSRWCLFNLQTLDTWENSDDLNHRITGIHFLCNISWEFNLSQHEHLYIGNTCFVFLHHARLVTVWGFAPQGEERK